MRSPRGPPCRRTRRLDPACLRENRSDRRSWCGGHLAKQKGTIRAAERRHREAIEDRLDGIADGAPGDEIGIVDFEIVALELEPAVDPRRESPTAHQEHAPVVDLWLLLAEPRPARSDRLGMSLRKLPRPRLEGQVELRDFNDVDG
jgi:hypothetical protein